MTFHTKEQVSPSTKPSLNKERQHIVNQVRRWGGSACDAVLDPACKIFSVESVEGIIGYREEPGCILVYGDPICPQSNLAALAHTFHQFCQKKNQNVIYIAATTTFMQWAMDNICNSNVEFGEELFIDPHDDPRERSGDNGSLVRRKVRHAMKEGTSVSEYVTNNPMLEQAIESVASSWLKSRQGPQIHTSNVHLFADCLGKRWFYAHQDEKIVGVLTLNQLQAQEGWLLNHVITTSDAPHGTPEILVVSALEAVRKEACHFVTFGPVPKKRLGQVVGFGKLSAWLARKGFDVASWHFHLEGRKKFWEKYHPQSLPLFILFSQPSIGLKEIKALKNALHVKF